MTKTGPEMKAASEDRNERKRNVEKYAGILAFATVCLALYGPFAWLLQLNFTTNSYHFQWLCLWPVMPGFAVGIPLAYFGFPGFLVSSGIVTVLLLVSLTRLSLRYQDGLIWAVAIALAISIPTSFVSHILFGS